MQESLTKEKILKKIRAALIEKTEHPFPKVDTESRLVAIPDTEREIVFAEALRSKGGNFLFAENHIDFIENFIGLCESKGWKEFNCFDQVISTFLNALDFNHNNIPTNNDNIEVIITTCECLIAQSGTIVISDQQHPASEFFTNAKVIIILAGIDQVFYELKDGLQYISLKYNKHYPSVLSMINGPFKNSEFKNQDPELQEVYLFLIESNKMLQLHELI